jgi:hypothetical protein
VRVNARLDETAAEQLEYLTESTGDTVSEVLRRSVASYYTQVRAQRQPSRFLAMAGSWSSGRSDTASNTRAAYAEALAAKYPQHTSRPPLAKPPPAKATPKSRKAGKR